MMTPWAWFKEIQQGIKRLLQLGEQMSTDLSKLNDALTHLTTANTAAVAVMAEAVTELRNATLNSGTDPTIQSALDAIASKIEAAAAGLNTASEALGATETPAPVATPPVAATSTPTSEPAAVTAPTPPAVPEVPADTSPASAAPAEATAAAAAGDTASGS